MAKYAFVFDLSNTEPPLRATSESFEAASHEEARIEARKRIEEMRRIHQDPFTLVSIVKLTEDGSRTLI